MVALDQRGVDPLDPWPAAGGVHRSGATQQEHRDSIAPGVEDCHARVLESNHIVQRGHHGSSGGFRIPVRQRDRDLLMGAQNGPRMAIPAVVDQRIVQTAEARARIERRVLDSQALQQVHYQVGAIFGHARRGGRRGDSGLFEDHAATATLRSRGKTCSA